MKLLLLERKVESRLLKPHTGPLSMARTEQHGQDLAPVDDTADWAASTGTSHGIYLT